MSESTSASSITGINHVGMSVSDLDAALTFYKGAVAVEAVDHPCNIEAERASGFTNEPIQRKTLRGPNGCLQLSQYDKNLSGPAEALAVCGPGITHVCYQSQTNDDIYSNFHRQGASAVSRGSAPISLLGRGVYYAYSRDTDGIMFETEHLDSPPFSDSFWIAHVALVSHDIDRLVEFYEMLFDNAPNRRANKAAGPTFDEVTDYDDVHIRAAWFDLSNMILELWQFVNPQTPEPGAATAIEKIGYNKVAYEVTDIEGEYTRLKALGVEFLSTPVMSEASTEVYGRDPDGNLFSLIEPSPGSISSIQNLQGRDW